MTAKPLALLGDSILDNKPYMQGAPDTTAQLEALLGPRWAVQLMAVDGAVMADMRRQVALLNGPCTAVLSVGGNDATQHIGLLTRPATSASAVLGDLQRIAEEFEVRYAETLDTVLPMVSRLVLCTIYDVRLQPAALARLARVPIALLNDRIISLAARRGLEVIELRTVCSDDDDFTLQIEPSAQGAEKIARAIAAVVDGPPDRRSGKVYAG